MVIIFYKHTRKTRWRPPKSSRGWKLQSETTKCHQQLLETPGDKSQCNLETLDARVAAVAQEHGSPSVFAKLKGSDEVVKSRAMRRQETCTATQKDLSKTLYKAVRRQRRERNNDKLDELIEKGQAGKLKNFARRPVTGDRIAGIKDVAGSLVKEQAGILEVFALFYEQLY